MKSHRSIRVFAIVLSAVITFALPVSAAPLPIQVCAVPNQAAAGNGNEAIILVYLANEDGSPNTNAEIPPQGPDGVELKGSKWSFETIAGPATFRGRTWANAAQTQQLDLPGQLRIMQLQPFFNRQAPADPRAGIYVLRIYPRYGYKGGRKVPLPWVSGEYTFRVSYKDGSNQGTTLGALNIR